MKHRPPVAWAVLAAVVALVPLAYASPPDPSWIGGLYDDADYDDVILLVLATADAVPTGVPTLAPAWHALGVVARAPAASPAVGAHAPHATRAPPRA